MPCQVLMEKILYITTKKRGAFEDYQLSFYIIQPPTPKRVMYDIFDRVNKGGTQLTYQEMRETLYMGKATEILKYLQKEKGSFLKATGNSIPEKRKKYVLNIKKRLLHVVVKFIKKEC